MGRSLEGGARLADGHAISAKRTLTRGWSITSEPLGHGEVRKLKAFGCLRFALNLGGCTPGGLYTVGLNVYGAELPVFGGILRFAFNPGAEVFDGVSKDQVNQYILATITADEEGDLKFRRYLSVEAGTYDVQLWVAKGVVSHSEGGPLVCYKSGLTFGDSERVTIRLDAARFCEPDYFPRPQERLPGDLRDFESRTFSQFGEDGILREIFRRLKLERGTFVEFGAETGEVGNCARLAREESWKGFFIEGDDGKCAGFEAIYRGNPRVKWAQAWVTSSGIESLFARLGVPENFDLLSIDIDGNDYWVWRAITSYRPILVVIEYNAMYPPPRRWVMAEDDAYTWDRSSHFGASLSSLAALGRQKGYRLIGTTSQGVNAFFLRDDYFYESLFIAGSVEYHYSRPAYGPFGAGHPYRDGPFVEI